MFEEEQGGCSFVFDIREISLFASLYQRSEKTTRSSCVKKRRKHISLGNNEYY